MGGHERIHAFHTPGARGEHQRGDALAVDSVHLCSPPQQQHDHWRGAGLGRPMQRAAPEFVRRANQPRIGKARERSDVPA